jgi:hypothetical protein
LHPQFGMSWPSGDDVVSTLAVVWVKQPDAETGGVSRGDLRGAGDRFLVGHEHLENARRGKEKKRNTGWRESSDHRRFHSMGPYCTTRTC